MSFSNHVTISGHLGADPEFYSYGEGKEAVKLRIATNVYQGKDKEEKTDWHTVKFFNSRVEGFKKLGLSKGDKIGITGQIRNDNYEKDDVKHYAYYILGEDLEIIRMKDSADREEAPAPRVAPPTSKPASPSKFKTNNLKPPTSDRSNRF